MNKSLHNISYQTFFPGLCQYSPWWSPQFLHPFTGHIDPLPINVMDISYSGGIPSLYFWSNQELNIRVFPSLSPHSCVSSQIVFSLFIILITLATPRRDLACTILSIYAALKDLVTERFRTMPI